MPERRIFLEALLMTSGGAFVGACKDDPSGEGKKSPEGPQGSRLPVVFVGHGSPMNAVEPTEWSQAFAELGKSLPKPRTILMVSAHWYGPGTFLTDGLRPKTIHDFRGFPKQLYEVQYPAPGDPDLAVMLANRLARYNAQPSSAWGFDHGSWSVLRWMFPDADTPVVQLSIDSTLTFRQHHELARSLADLREQGILVIGSGNVTHNLRDAMARRQRRDPSVPEWAAQFDAEVRQIALNRDDARLVDLPDASPDWANAHPTPEHFLPFVYAQAVTDDRDAVRFVNEGFDLGSISMRSVVWG